MQDMIRIHLGDNIEIMKYLYDSGVKVDLIYADCIYESINFTWAYYAADLLKDNGIIIVQTDHHTVFDYWINFTDEFEFDLPLTFVNHLVWKNEWGNHPKDRFHQCFDDILIFCKGNEWKFHSDRIQVPKATANTKLNPSGRQTKTATAWIDDICLTTTSKERIVDPTTGHLIKWQKPIKLIERLVAPFVDAGDTILDPFMGTGTTAIVASGLGCNFIGIENDPDVFNLAKERIECTV